SSSTRWSSSIRRGGRARPAGREPGGPAVSCGSPEPGRYARLAGVAAWRCTTQAASGTGGLSPSTAPTSAFLPDPRVPTSTTTAGLPFGGLAHVLPATQPAGVTPAGLLRWAVDAMRQQAGRRAIVLAVDDAHQLDQMSATLVYYMARSGQATVVATMRSGEPAP